MASDMPAGSLRQRIDRFRFTHRTVDGRKIRLGYALAGPSETIAFEETLDIPDSLGPLAAGDDPAVVRALAALHLAGGTSYWKTCVPKHLAVDEGTLSAADAAFWTEAYTKGMAEFFYRNGIDPAGAVQFERTGSTPQPAPAPPCDGPALLLWGGGKDSVVSHEAHAASAEPHELLTVGRAGWEWIGRSAGIAGRPHHVVERRLDPRLSELNAAGELNGHVPISAYLAFAGLVLALLTRRSAVIASNEASASFGSTSWRGLDVNHQWSKSLEFERGVAAWRARNLAGGPEYLSLLRPWTELRIVRAFARHPGYFPAVTSCNRNFSQSGPAPARWCLTCPKCVFVSLMARPWLDDGRYHALFGGDALADPANTDTIAELLGLRGMKPFECVGTPDESIAAIHLARSRGRVLPHGSMTLFNDRIAQTAGDLEEIARKALSTSSDHALAPRWSEILERYAARS